MKSRWVVILFTFGALLSVFVHPFLILALISLFLAVFFLARNLGFGLLLLVFFFPYLGLVVDFGSFEALREVPYLRDVNAPFIDLYGLMLFGAWMVNLLLRHSEPQYQSEARYGVALREESRTDVRPRIRERSFVASLLRMTKEVHLKSYLAFWLSGLVSLFKVSSIQFAVSIKYFARPFTFAYLVFFAPVVNILGNPKSQIPNPKQISDSKFQIPSLLHRVLTVFYFTGLLSAFNGFLGLLFGPHLDFPRATPWGAFGVSPLGFNHNLLAETLIATAPAGLLLYKAELWRGKSSALYTRWILYGSFFQWSIALLTFARTAWIAVAVQAVVYLWFSRRQKTEDRSVLRPPSSVLRFLRAHWLYAMVLFVFLAFLATTTFTETVRGSTLSRLDQARIAAFYFEQSPFIGQGVGTFLPSLWQVRAFLLEYGEPVEAHGVIFKLMFEQGLFGLIAFAIFIGTILRSIQKSGNVPALLIAAGSIAYQFFNTTYYTSKLWIPLAVAVALSKIYADSRHNTKMVS